MNLHKISFMKLQTDIPEVRGCLLNPNDTPIQGQGLPSVWKFDKQGHAIFHVYTFRSGKLGSLSRGIAEKNIGSVIPAGMLILDRKTRQETFKQPVIIFQGYGSILFHKNRSLGRFGRFSFEIILQPGP